MTAIGIRPRSTSSPKPDTRTLIGCGLAAAAVLPVLWMTRPVPTMSCTTIPDSLRGLLATVAQLSPEQHKFAIACGWVHTYRGRVELTGAGTWHSGVERWGGLSNPTASIQWWCGMRIGEDPDGSAPTHSRSWSTGGG